MERNCWLQRTPLETGLILILTVAVPFLIAMIIIYIVVPQSCKNCSVSCVEICNYRFITRSSIMPSILQLHPNVSLPKLAKKYEICPDSMLKNFALQADHPFVASVLQDVYIDDTKVQRYLGPAAVVTFKWIVSSSKHLQEQNADVYGLFVRAGSNYWTHDGSVHDIKRIVFVDKTFPATMAAIELKTEFPRLPSIRPVMLSRKSLFENFGVVEMHGWQSNDSLPLQFRKKYVKMSSEPGAMFKDSQCEEKSKNQSLMFCAMKVKLTKEPCLYHTGFLIVRGSVLMGLDIGQYCDADQNAMVHLIYDMNKGLKCLERFTGVYVEHL